MKPTLLSIDWDFFIYNPSATEVPPFDITVFPGTPKETKTTSAHVCDWGGHECFGRGIAEAIWLTRVGGLLRVGVDPLSIMGIIPEKGCVTPDDFIRIVSERFHLNDAEQYVGDSHAYGFCCAQYVWSLAESGPIRVVSFDAHHDLGYSDAEIADEIKRNQSDCASWLFHAIHNHMVDEAIIVYPDWKGLREFEPIKKYKHLRKVLPKVKAYTWSQFVANNTIATDSDINLVYQARSSGWTPPWLDGEFVKFYNALPTGDNTCVDCMKVFGQKVGAMDGCTPRGWDWDGVRLLSTSWQKLLERNDAASGEEVSAG